MNKLTKGPAVAYVICGLCIIAYIFVIWIHLANYNYRYPMIPDAGAFVVHTVLTLSIPFLGLLFLFIAIKNRKLSLTILATVVCVTLFFVSFARGTAEILYYPTVVSRTTDASHFGKYDKALNDSLKLNPASDFPDAIPSKACEIQYSYYYECASSETVYIAISWKYSDSSDYIQERAKYSALTPEGESVVHFTESLYDVACLFDDETCTIAYVLCNGSTGSLPTTLDEVFENS